MPLDKVRGWLAAVWGIGASAVFVLLVVQSQLGRYGDKTQEAWGWFLPTIMPTAGMITTVLGYTALNPMQLMVDVRKSFFHAATFLSLLYLVLILLTILLQPFRALDASKAVQSMQQSNLWLGPLQGIVAASLGVLFFSKQEKAGEPPKSPVS